MDNKGYIKLYRRLRNKAFYKRSRYLQLWIHLLLSANHKKEEILWNKKTLELKPGQFLTGRKKLSEATGIPATTIERILDFFESGQQIKQEKTTKFRIITLKKWSEYQVKPPKMDTKRTTSGQQADTNKNDKNDKNTTIVAKQSFAKEIYLKLHLLYKKEKGIEPQGEEWNRIDKAIKTMLKSDRTLEEISACIEWFGWAAKQDNKKYEWTKSWTMETIARKMPEFLAGKLEKKDWVNPAYLKTFHPEKQ